MVRGEKTGFIVACLPGGQCREKGAGRGPAPWSFRPCWANLTHSGQWWRTRCPGWVTRLWLPRSGENIGQDGMVVMSTASAGLFWGSTLETAESTDPAAPDAVACGHLRCAAQRRTGQHVEQPRPAAAGQGARRWTLDAGMASPQIGPHGAPAEERVAPTGERD